MATGSIIPYSNPAGNNQTTPSPLPVNSSGAVNTQGVVGGSASSPVPISSPLTPTAASAANPLIPATAVTAPVPTSTTTAGSPVLSVGSTSTNAANTQAQFSDIYGEGVGTDLTNLLNSIGGTDSATLQEYTASLAPQEATAQANLDASLGAGGVSANSSVAAIGNANLQAQETGMIAGEEANLTQSGQNLEASILSGTESAAEQEVANSGWDVFGDVLQGVGNLAGKTVTAAGLAGGFSNLV